MDKLDLNTSDLYLSNNFEIKENAYIDYRNKVCLKPWGFEYLTYESTKLGTWFLKINNSCGTSTHTHFQKDTIMIVLSGKIKLNMVDGFKIYNESSVIYIPKRKFHGIISITETAYVLEIEIFDDDVNFSDKNDLLRLVDKYKREKTGYSGSVKIEEENISDYNYFYFKENETNIVNNTILSFGNLDTLENNKNKKYDNSIYILYKNPLVINNKIIKEGSYFNYEEIKSLDFNKFKKNIFLKVEFTDLLNNKIITTEEELCYILENQIKNEKNILTSGCFDILHTGHISNLQKAASLGDNLLVLLSSDEQIKALKGESRPINCLEDRINVFKTIPFITYIVVYKENIKTDPKSEEELDKFINIIKPDIWVKGAEYKEEEIRLKHPSLKEIFLIDTVEGKSTTNIINTIKKKKI